MTRLIRSKPTGLGRAAPRRRFHVLALIGCLLLAAACQPAPAAPASPTVTAPVRIVVSTAAPTIPTATPACVPLPAGATITATETTPGRVQVAVTGFQPGEMLRLVVYAEMVNSGTRLEQDPITPVDQTGNYTFGSLNLEQYTKGSPSVAWHVQVIHARGAACTTITLNTPAPELSQVLLDLPIWGGAVWVYSYAEYQPASGDPTQTITATYTVTDTVVDEQLSPFIAHVRHEESPSQVPANWASPLPSRPAEWWYALVGQQIYQSFQPIDWSRIDTTTMTLAYDLPLSLGQSWCPEWVLKGQPVADCAAAGRRTVISQGSYATPAGQFDNCFLVSEDHNSGGITRWLCRGVGLVAQTYDHAGTRFGSTQVLIASRPGSF